MIKFPEFNNLENISNLEKLSNTLCLGNLKKIMENEFVNKIIE